MRGRNSSPRWRRACRSGSIIAIEDRDAVSRVGKGGRDQARRRARRAARADAVVHEPPAGASGAACIAGCAASAASGATHSPPPACQTRALTRTIAAIARFQGSAEFNWNGSCRTRTWTPEPGTLEPYVRIADDRGAEAGRSPRRPARSRDAFVTDHHAEDQRDHGNQERGRRRLRRAHAAGGRRGENRRDRGAARAEARASRAPGAATSRPLSDRGQPERRGQDQGHAERAPDHRDGAVALLQRPRDVERDAVGDQRRHDQRRRRTRCSAPPSAGSAITTAPPKPTTRPTTCRARAADARAGWPPRRRRAASRRSTSRSAPTTRAARRTETC